MLSRTWTRLKIAPLGMDIVSYSRGAQGYQRPERTSRPLKQARPKPTNPLQLPPRSIHDSSVRSPAAGPLKARVQAPPMHRLVPPALVVLTPQDRIGAHVVAGYIAPRRAGLPRGIVQDENARLAAVCGLADEPGPCRVLVAAAARVVELAAFPEGRLISGLCRGRELARY